MTRTLGLAALVCLASMALAMPARPARAQQQPSRQTPAPPSLAPAAQPGTAAQAASEQAGLPVAPPAPAPIVTRPKMTTVQVNHYWYLLALADLSWLWASIRLDREQLAFVAYPTLAPAVHLLMGNGRNALESAAVRIGVGALTCLYVTAGDADDEEILITGGVFLGAGALFDWFYLGRKFETVRLPAQGESSTWTWTPSVVAGAHGLQVGISGAF